jgi:hypothetical protein
VAPPGRDVGCEPRVPARGPQARAGGLRPYGTGPLRLRRMLVLADHGGMTTTQVLDLELVEAYFVGGPADGTTTLIHVETTGFPPVHVSVPDPDGVTRHMYGGLGLGRSALPVFRYLGPLPS